MFRIQLNPQAEFSSFDNVWGVLRQAPAVPIDTVHAGAKDRMTSIREMSMPHVNPPNTPSNTALLWVDARLNKLRPSILAEVPLECARHVTEDVKHAHIAVQKLMPQVIVFDFDYAEITGLKSLRRIKVAHPGVPLVMLSEQHYEGLSIWALRCRVWDYLVKPLDSEVLGSRLQLLINADVERFCDPAWAQLLPPNQIPREARIIGDKRADQSLHAAVAYMEDHLHEKITAEEVSRQCGLNRYELSRVFKSECGVTYRDYLLNLRVKRAERMLLHTHASIGDIALSVGFNDLSHFTRSFRRLTGCCPSVFRSRQQG